ncbi:MAG: hypothetical protein ACOYOS_13415 [Syntrophales bacterium]
MTKKIDDAVAQQMRKDGKQQREIADHFNVSESAMSQWSKRQQKSELPESFKALTAGEQKFVLAKVSGKSSAAAAMDSFECGSYDSGKTIGSRLNGDPDVQRAIHDLLHEEGIGRRYRVQRLKAVINSSDLGLCAKGVEIANKMVGDYLPEKLTVEINFPELQRQMFEAADRLREHYLAEGKRDIYDIMPDRVEVKD